VYYRGVAISFSIFENGPDYIIADAMVKMGGVALVESVGTEDKATNPKGY
jgi:hypothetical protein